MSVNHYNHYIPDETELLLQPLLLMVPKWLTVHYIINIYYKLIS